jgi:hypothetical protein
VERFAEGQGDGRIASPVNFETNKQRLIALRELQSEQKENGNTLVGQQVLERPIVG